MALFDDLSYRLRSLFRRPEKEAGLEEELRFHLEMEIEHRIAAGEERAAAERAARLAFGAPESVKEAVRDAWGTRFLDDAARDATTAFRQLAGAPAFAIAAISSLAVGLGAVTVIFSVVDAVLLRPLPFGEPERIVAFFEVTPSGDRFSTSDLNLLDFRAGSASLEHIAAVAFPEPRPALAVGDQRVRLEAQAVTASFFEVFGVEATLGRAFEAGEEEGRGPPMRAVVLSAQAWRQYFAADPQIVGSEIDLDGEMHTVLGVLPEDFRYGSSRPALYLPYRVDPSFERGDHRLSAYARLADGASLQQARDEVAAIAAHLAEEYEENAGWTTELVPIEELLLGEEVRHT
ncbi:MAG: ABC transporter permease, partial [Holophagales bacterium]|nr:ABC transporter permease [Holophagales bacterium]